MLYTFKYYVNKGHSIDSLTSLSASERLFLMASMELTLAEEKEKYEALSGKS